jgi:hypothetical protein
MTSTEDYRLTLADLLARLAEARARGGEVDIIDRLVAVLILLPMMTTNVGCDGCGRVPLEAHVSELPADETDLDPGAQRRQSFMRWACGEIG